MWVKRVWNIVRNDGIPDDKKYLDVIFWKIKNPYIRQQYDLCKAKIIAMIKKDIIIYCQRSIRNIIFLTTG